MTLRVRPPTPKFVTFLQKCLPRPTKMRLVKFCVSSAIGVLTALGSLAPIGGPVGSLGFVGAALGFESSAFAATAVKTAQKSASQGAAAAEVVASKFYGKTIVDIEIKGNQRIEREAVVGKLQSKKGGKLDREVIRADILAIYEMGYFDDISFLADPSGDGVLISIAVKERPVISKIEFEGNDRISTSDLQEVIKIKEWSILDINKVKEDVARIQKHYEDKGFYLAKVTHELSKGAQADQVELIFHVSDFDKVQIKKITFLNNKAYSDEHLKSVLGETREGSFLSFLNDSGSFKEGSFKQDLQRLVYWYFDHGYVKFMHEAPIITVSDDKKWLFITIYVNEGEKYNMGTTKFSGDLLFTDEELRKDLQLKENETWMISKRNNDIQKLTEMYQDLGYAFVNVIPNMNIKDEEKIVDIDYGFEKGTLVYFGEINLLGNTKTHDKVLRRELRIHEGELFSGSKLRESKENIERLGYFAPGEVIFNQITPKGKNEILNIDISVKERSTGSITLGAGYGSLNGFFFQTQLSEINLFGRGQTLQLQAAFSAQQSDKSFNLGFTEPYTYDSKWSSGFDLFYVMQGIPGKYNTRKTGFDLRLGHPVYDYTNAFITYKNEFMRLESTAGSTVRQEDIDADSGTLSSIVWSLVRDKRNNRFEPSGGDYESASFETAGLGGTKRFLKLNANTRFYRKVVGDLTFRNSLEFGQVFQVGDHMIPPLERFYLGTPNNMRGFTPLSISPYVMRTDSNGKEQKYFTGGTSEMLAIAELEYPLIKEAGLKFVSFLEAGNSFDKFPGWQQLKFRADWGLGLRWFSPIGPLRFEWGFPINRQGDETDSNFVFMIGPPF